MHDIDLIDSGFEKNKTNEYTLSIQTGLSGLCFSVFDPLLNKYIVLRNYPFEGLEGYSEIANYLNAIYIEDEILKLKFKKILFSFVSEQSTLIPGNEFNPENTKDYWNFTLTPYSEKQEYFNHPISEINCFTVYNIPNNLYVLVNKLFPGVQIIHFSLPAISYLISEALGKKMPACFIYLNSDFLSIYFAQNNRLLYANSFVYQDKSDVLYYILSVMEQFELPPQITPLYFSTDSKDHDELFNLLNSYFGLIKFIRPTSKFQYSLLFDELFLSRFCTLFNLALCA